MSLPVTRRASYYYIVVQLDLPPMHHWHKLEIDQLDSWLNSPHTVCKKSGDSGVPGPSVAMFGPNSTHWPAYFPLNKLI